MTESEPRRLMLAPACSIGCGICTKKCPFEAINIIKLPTNLEADTTHRYSANSFKLHRLPTPRAGQVLGLVGGELRSLRMFQFGPPLTRLFIYSKRHWQEHRAQDPGGKAKAKPRPVRCEFGQPRCTQGTPLMLHFRIHRIGKRSSNTSADLSCKTFSQRCWRRTSRR